MVAVWVSIGVVAAAAVAYWLPIMLIVQATPDDAYFYLKTAHNLALGHGSTFDGVNPTNGYHPLWFLLVAGVFRVAHAFGGVTSEALLRLVFLVALALSFATGYVVAAVLRTLEPATPRAMATVACGLATILLALDGHVGTESHLVMLLTALYLWARITDVTQMRDRVFLRAVLLGLLALSRIDFLFTVVPVIAAFEIATIGASKKKRATLIIGSTVGTIAVVYFALNDLLFGHPLPVSMVVKSTFPRPVLMPSLAIYWNELYSGEWYVAAVVSAVRIAIPLIVTAWFAWHIWRRRTRLRELDQVLLACGTAAVSFVLGHALFDRFFISPWYMGFPSVVAVVMIGSVLTTRRQWATAAGLGTVATATYALAFSYFVGPPWAYAYAKEMSRVTNATDTIYQYDMSGLVGFFSERRVINGDGLINSLELVRYLRAGKPLTEYLQAHAIGYYSSELMGDVNADYPNLPPVYVDGSLPEDVAGDFTCRPSQIVLKVHDWMLCRIQP